MWFERAKELVRSWGGHIVEMGAVGFHRLIDIDNYDDELIEARGCPVSEAPFVNEYAINYDKRVLYIVRGQARPNPVIHELGHLFACPHGPDGSHEIDWLGWEVCLARHLGVYEGYGLSNEAGNGGDWGWVTARFKSDVVRRSIQEGIDAGIIEAGSLMPLSIRGPKKPA